MRAIAGDRDAFAALYERYERRVYNVCYRILGSPEEAADATQDAFANVLRRLPRMSGRELSFGSYVFKAARNASYDAVKRRGAVQLTDAVADTAVSVTGDDPVEDPARRLLLAAQQESLRRAQRAAFRSASARSWPCARWASCPTTRSRRSWA